MGRWDPYSRAGQSNTRQHDSTTPRVYDRTAVNMDNLEASKAARVLGIHSLLNTYEFHGSAIYVPCALHDIWRCAVFRTCSIDTVCDRRIGKHTCAHTYARTHAHARTLSLCSHHSHATTHVLYLLVSTRSSNALHKHNSRPKNIPPPSASQPHPRCCMNTTEYPLLRFEHSRGAAVFLVHSGRNFLSRTALHDERRKSVLVPYRW